jgi:hypothetical protein
MDFAMLATTSAARPSRCVQANDIANILLNIFVANIGIYKFGVEVKDFIVIRNGFCQDHFLFLPSCYPQNPGLDNNPTFP